MSIINAVSPLDGAPLGSYVTDTPEAITAKIAAARIAAVQWGAVDVELRVKKLAQLRRLLAAELDGIIKTLVRTSGKVRTDALLGEVYPIFDALDYYCKRATTILRYRGVPTSPFAFPGATAGIERRPYGVVAVISPWNYPFQLSALPMISALLAGNAVLLKPSELSLPVGALLISLFGKLNLPDGLVQWVIGDGQAGALLIDAAPDLVFFTGGTAAGRAVMRRAARHPIPVLLELGGKDAMLVFADAHLQRACDAALYGAFLNSGQVCIAVERLYVQRNAYESFVQDLCAGAARLKAGRNGEGDIGAMTSPRQIEIVAAHYEDALRQGARASGPLIRDGNYLQPVVLWNVHHGMQVVREETFGPLLPVMAFDDEDDAVRSANDSLFGLNASIWSGDLQKAERVARRLQVGNWMINDVLKNVGHPGLPFGGVRHSGFGRYHGAEGLRNFTYSVSCMISRSRLPKEPNWFPYSEERYRQFRAYVDCLYGEGSLYHRIKRNWRALQAFRDYAAFDFKQRILNLKLYLQPWKRDD